LKSTRKFLINIVGPTASGKTALAIELAKVFSTEILSSDSRQFYKEVSIGTAKPSKEELAQVKHHLINSHSVSETYNAGQFARDAEKIILSLFKSNNVVIVVGGSGLYIKALTNGIDPGAEANEKLRAELKAGFEKNGIEFLQARLRSISEEIFNQVDSRNPQRLMRAIEKAESKALIGATKEEEKEYSIITIGVNLPREELYQRINKRVDAMIEAGLEAEAQKMLPYRNTYAMQTVGYKELFSFFDGEISREKAIELIKQHTRQFAKRQITWFKNQTDAKWFSPSDISEIIRLIRIRMEE